MCSLFTHTSKCPSFLDGSSVTGSISRKCKHVRYTNICTFYYSRFAVSSVRPKPGFCIGNRNQDQLSVSVSGPELFMPKHKLSSIFSPLIFLVWESHWYRIIIVSSQLPRKCQIIYLIDIYALQKLGSDMAMLLCVFSKNFCRPLDITLSNLRFFGFG